VGRVGCRAAGLSIEHEWLLYSSRQQQMSMSSLSDPPWHLPPTLDSQCSNEMVIVFFSLYTFLHVQLQMTHWRKQNCKCRVQYPSNIRNISSTRGRKIQNYLNKCDLSFIILYITKTLLYTKHCILDILHQRFWKYNLSFLNRAVKLRTCIREIRCSNFLGGMPTMLTDAALNPLQKIPWMCLKISHDRIFPHTSQFISITVWE
jgi:hypothetical protein